MEHSADVANHTTLGLSDNVMFQGIHIQVDYVLHDHTVVQLYCCFSLSAVATTVQGGPIGGQTRISLRNDHLQYVFTW